MRIWTLVLAGFILISCSANTQVIISPDDDFLRYKRAYLRVLDKDQFNLASAINYQLSDMGVEVMAKLPPDPPENSMVVNYTYDDGWDWTIYLKSFQVIFMNAISGKVIANISYQLSGRWTPTEMRIIDAFNEFRRKIGMKELAGGTPADQKGVQR